MSLLCGPKTEIRVSKLIAGAICFASELLLAGCMVGPNYRRPTAEVPATYKEVGNWKQAQPNEQNLGGNWWEMFRIAAERLNAGQRVQPKLEGGGSPIYTGSCARPLPTGRLLSHHDGASATRNKYRTIGLRVSSPMELPTTTFKFPCNCLTKLTSGDACAAPLSPLATRHKPARPTWQP